MGRCTGTISTLCIRIWTKEISSIDISKDVPPAFVNFCRQAKSSVESGQSNIEHHIVKYKGNELSGHAITSAYSNFHGADMIFCQLQRYVYTGWLICNFCFCREVPRKMWKGWGTLQKKSIRLLHCQLTLPWSCAILTYYKTYE